MAHAATIEQTESGFEVTCPECGTVGSDDAEALADLVKRFHDGAFKLAGSASDRSSSGSCHLDGENREATA